MGYQFQLNGAPAGPIRETLAGAFNDAVRANFAEWVNKDLPLIRIIKKRGWNPDLQFPKIDSATPTAAT